MPHTHTHACMRDSVSGGTMMSVLPNKARNPDRIPRCTFRPTWASKSRLIPSLIPDSIVQNSRFPSISQLVSISLQPGCLFVGSHAQLTTPKSTPVLQLVLVNLLLQDRRAFRVLETFNPRNLYFPFGFLGLLPRFNFTSILLLLNAHIKFNESLNYNTGKKWTATRFTKWNWLPFFQSKKVDKDEV